jgi:hypothetical protein
MSQLPLCEGHVLTVVDGLVLVEGAGDRAFFEKAEEVEELKVGGPGGGGGCLLCGLVVVVMMMMMMMMMMMIEEEEEEGGGHDEDEDDDDDKTLSLPRLLRWAVQWAVGGALLGRGWCAAAPCSAIPPRPSPPRPRPRTHPAPLPLPHRRSAPAPAATWTARSTCATRRRPSWRGRR